MTLTLVFLTCEMGIYFALTFKDAVRTDALKEYQSCFKYLKKKKKANHVCRYKKEYA